MLGWYRRRIERRTEERLKKPNEDELAKAQQLLEQNAASQQAQRDLELKKENEPVESSILDECNIVRQLSAYEKKHGIDLNGLEQS